MLRPQHALAGFQRPPTQRLRARVVAFTPQQFGQIVHAGQRVGMLRPPHALVGFQRPLQQRLGGGIQAVIAKKLPKLRGQGMVADVARDCGPPRIGCRIAATHVAT